jgi:transcriptional regulator with XRE-family HTH domain
MDGAQSRMARAALRWSAQQLADKAGVHYATVARLEAGGSIADESRDKLVKALTDAGAQFSRHGGRKGVTVPE